MFCNRIIFIILGQQTHKDDVGFDTQVEPTDGVVMSSFLDTYATPDELFPPHPQEDNSIQEILHT